MRASENPPFSVSHWQSLWANNIADIDRLRAEYAESGIVSVDIEPWSEDSRLPSEIAFSFLPPAELDGSGIVHPPETIRLFPANEVLETHTIAIKGREGNPRKRESLYYGDVRMVEADQVEDAIVEILESFSNKPELDKLRLVLTGWDLALEFSVLSRDYPTALSYFSAWTDMQEQTLSVSTAEKISLSMASCLHELGLVLKPPGASPWSHRAGNDTVRIIAIFLRLVNRTQHSPPLSIQQKPKKKWSTAAARQSYKSDKIFQSRPRPADKFPFLAKLSHDGALIQRSGVGLLDLFAEYDPSAVGVSHKRRKRAHVWISLPSPSLLRRFVEDVDGSELDGKVLKAEAHITAGFENVTDEEWSEVQESREAEEQRAEEAQKENIRLSRRERMDLDADLGCMALFTEDEDSYLTLFDEGEDSCLAVP